MHNGTTNQFSTIIDTIIDTFSVTNSQTLSYIIALFAFLSLLFYNQYKLKNYFKILYASVYTFFESFSYLTWENYIKTYLINEDEYIIFNLYKIIQLKIILWIYQLIQLLQKYIMILKIMIITILLKEEKVDIEDI